MRCKKHTGHNKPHKAPPGPPWFHCSFKGYMLSRGYLAVWDDEQKAARLFDPITGRELAQYSDYAMTIHQHGGPKHTGLNSWGQVVAVLREIYPRPSTPKTELSHSTKTA